MGEPATPGGRATLDFFAAQANARHRTRLLVASFAGALCAIVAVVYAALVVAVSAAGAGAPPGSGAELVPFDPFQPFLLVAATVGVLGLTAAGSLYHAVRLESGGGDAVARMLGGTEVDRGTQDLLRRRLVNVTEEMAIAAGLPVPRLYVLEGEAGINAFATGFTPGHSVVAVTRGALEHLDRDELQGVVAHELSHVLNSDTRIDLRLMEVVGGLTVLSLVGRLILQNTPSSRSRDDKGRGGSVLVGLALLVAGAFGAFCGKLVRYAVSRQREWLADASSVQFTRNPDGLGRALLEIQRQGSALSSPHAPEAAHLFLASGGTGLWSGLLSTHPPLEERIRRVAPHLLAAAGATAATAGRAPAPPLAGAAPLAAPGAPPPAGYAGVAASAPAATARVMERPSPAHVDHAADQLARLPPGLAAAAREPFGARAVASALLLSANPGDRGRQLAYLSGRDPALGAEVARLAPQVDAVARVDRMALLGLAVPALDALSAAQSEALAADLRALAAGDGAITPFEWAAQRVAVRRLSRGSGRPPAPTLRSVDEAAPELLQVLSTVAWLGSRDPARAQAALDAALASIGPALPRAGAAGWRVLPRDRIGPDRLDAALARLDEAAPAVKGLLLRASVASALADARVTVEEAELVRAVAASLGLPMPPIVAG